MGEGTLGNSEAQKTPHLKGNLYLPGPLLDKENVKINGCNVLLKILQKEQDKSKEGRGEK